MSVEKLQVILPANVFPKPAEALWDGNGDGTVYHITKGGA